MENYTKERLVKWIDQYFKNNEGKSTSYILYVLLSNGRRNNANIENIIEILKDRGYTILDMLEMYFHNLHLIDTNPYYIYWFNDVANHTDLRSIVNKYGDKSYFNLWYDNVMLSQI